jgi:2-isopropylmalate synthase
MSLDTPEQLSPTGAPGAVALYDTTLRDGTQREGLTLSCDDKLRIARTLDAFGLSFIEGGWPGSNPKDAEFFERAKDVEFKTAALAAFGATRRAGIAPEDDPSLQALVASETPVCTIFGKSWKLHVEILRVSFDENLRMVEESVAFLRRHGRRVVYDAEHFFDGWRDDASYAVETLRAAQRGGAEVLVLCDTNGGSLPWQIEAAVAQVKAAVPAPLGIHAHDDAGLAVANSLAAVRAGARHVQGTINGYGERCGNANLCSIAPDLELKMGLSCLPKGALRELYELAHFVAEVANLAPNEHQAYAGRSAFAHKGGVHVSAMRRNSASYQHVDPALVGNEARVVVSELSGKSNLLSRAEELGLSISDGGEKEVLEKIKEAEARGFAFEVAAGSVALMLQRKTPGHKSPFELLDYKVMVTQRGDGQTYSEATVKIAVHGQVVHTAAEGNGPVSALDAALRKALLPIHPAVAGIHLVDYKVRILDGDNATRATTRVLVDSTDGHKTWTTVGASANIIEASWHALADGIEYGLVYQGRPEAQPPVEALLSAAAQERP